MHSVRLAEPLLDVRFAWMAYPGPAFRQVLDASVSAAQKIGVLEGEQRVNEQLIQQRAEVLQLQQGALKAIRESLSQVVREAEQNLVKIALAAASKVIGSMPISAEMIETVIREALREVKAQAEAVVLVHPEDYELLQRYGSSLLGPDENKIRFQISKEVSRGGCLIKTDFGSINALRETKLELLHRAVGA